MKRYLAEQTFSYILCNNMPVIKTSTHKVVFSHYIYRKFCKGTNCGSCYVGRLYNKNMVCLITYLERRYAV